MSSSPFFLRSLLGVLALAWLSSLQANPLPSPEKYTQLPDLTPQGIDVELALPRVLADDFPCNQTGPITGIHVWHLYLIDQVIPAATWQLSLWSNVPDPDGSGPLFSQPGQLLWTHLAVPNNVPWAGPIIPGEGYLDPLIAPSQGVMGVRSAIAAAPSLAAGRATMACIFARFVHKQAA